MAQTLSLPAKIERLRRPHHDLLHLVLRSGGANQHLIFVLAPPLSGPYFCDEAPQPGQAPHPSQAMLRRGVTAPIVGLRRAPGLWELYTAGGAVLCIGWRRKMCGVWWADEGRLGGELERQIGDCDDVVLADFDAVRSAAVLALWRKKEHARLQRNISKITAQANADDPVYLRDLAARANALRGQVEHRGEGWLIPHYDDAKPEIINAPKIRDVSSLVDQLFHRAKRAERRQDAAVERLAFLRQQLDELANALPPAVSRSRPHDKPTTIKGIRTFQLSDGHALMVGRNAQANHRLTFQLARGRDLWFHVRDSPGSHVILRLAKGEDAPSALRLAGAALALHYSPLCGERADVRMAHRRDLASVPGQPGLALVRREQVLVVDPRSAHVRQALAQLGLDLSSSRRTPNQ